MFQHSTQTNPSPLGETQTELEAQNELGNAQQEINAQRGDQTPRFVTCISHDVYNGNLKEYTWDKEKIFVHECLQDDLLMLQNVFEGKIISALVYPLVFDYKSPQKEMSLRSIQFYKEVLVDNSLYHNLSSDDKGYFFIGVRDLFIAACRGILSQDEKEILMNITNLIDPRDNNIVYKTMNNIDIAPYPTAIHKMVRFIEEEPEEENNILDECFVRNELGLLIAFVDSRDLSFHNFENIINLDSLFQAGEEFPISNFGKYEDEEVYTFDLEDKRGLLLSLDKCGLYTQPINKLSRGGERFIFSSRILGDSLTSALQEYADEDFKFVNYVFRYNKFKPGDRKFTSHFDTPYNDTGRKIYSRFTLLLYLTPGTADPVLNIENGAVTIESIEDTGYVKGVIFDQKYEHEGKSFIDSDKIFLRTELIYCYPEEGFSFNADISRKFNIACYMTKQSVFNPELEKYASDCFNQVAQARLDLAKVNLTEDVLLFKKYGDISFITNGYDYWFLKNTCLKSAAIITLLDYLGCKSVGFEMKDYAYGFLSSKSQAVDQDVLKNVEKIKDVKEILKYLKNHAQVNNEVVNEENSNEPIIIKEEEKTIEKPENEVDISKTLIVDDPWDWDRDYKEKKEVESSHILKALDCDLKNLIINLKLSFENEKKKIDLASIHKELNWGECRTCRYEHPDYAEVEYELRNQSLQSDFQFETFLIFDKEIKFADSRMKINKNSIVFDEQIPSVHFAACKMFAEAQWDKGITFDKDPIDVTLYSNLPPIQYAIHDEGYHLKIELFNNGFIREKSKTFIKASFKEDYFGKLFEGDWE